MTLRTTPHHFNCKLFYQKTEAIVNLRPLVYFGNDLNDRITITQSHFLSPNTKTSVPIIKYEDENDPDFEPNQPPSSSILLNVWKKGQRLLGSFWKIWQGNYLLSL